ncbi:hypothetical protein, partial [Paenibacillus sp. TY11]|uniref:hypothetical protein n=1 Tax=Paenibacillus sp. TY11 TaxID=3448633 RepID=UPI00403A0869
WSRMASTLVSNVYSLNFVPFFAGIKNAPPRFHRINQGFIPMSILRGALQVTEGLSKIYFNADPLASNNGMDKFKEHFSSNLMISLENCADYLSEHSTEEVVEDERILELLKEVYELEEFIINSKLQNELEKILIYQLNNVRDSLLKYKFYGSQGIIDSVATTLGTLIWNREKIEHNNDKGTVERIFKLVVKINSIFSLKDNSIKLIGEIFRKLTGGDN